MKETLNQNNENQNPLKFKTEVLFDGDVYRFSAESMETLLAIAGKIAVGLDQREHEIRAILKELEQGGDWRIDGTFNLKIYNNILTFDNRNARGIREYRDIMKKVTNVLAE